MNLSFSQYFGFLLVSILLTASGCGPQGNSAPQTQGSTAQERPADLGKPHHGLDLPTNREPGTPRPLPGATSDNPYRPSGALDWTVEPCLGLGFCPGAFTATGTPNSKLQPTAIVEKIKKGIQDCGIRFDGVSFSSLPHSCLNSGLEILAMTGTGSSKAYLLTDTNSREQAVLAFSIDRKSLGKYEFHTFYVLPQVNGTDVERAIQDGNFYLSYSVNDRTAQLGSDLALLSAPPADVRQIYHAFDRVFQNHCRYRFNGNKELLHQKIVASKDAIKNAAIGSNDDVYSFSLMKNLDEAFGQRFALNLDLAEHYRGSSSQDLSQMSAVILGENGEEGAEIMETVRDAMQNKKHVFLRERGLLAYSKLQQNKTVADTEIVIELMHDADVRATAFKVGPQYPWTGKEAALGKFVSFGEYYNDTDIKIRRASVAMLADLKTDLATELLIVALGNNARLVRNEAFTKLEGDLQKNLRSCDGKEDALAALLSFGEYYNDADVEARKNAIKLLSFVKSEKGTAYLIKAMGNDARSARKEAFERLQENLRNGKNGCVGHEVALAKLLTFGDYYNDADVEARNNAITILSFTGSTIATDALISAMGNDATAARKAAYEGLLSALQSGLQSAVGKEDALGQILSFGNYYNDNDVAARKNAVSILSFIGTSAATDALIKAMGNDASAVRKEAREVLDRALKSGRLSFAGKEDALGKLLSFGEYYNAQDVEVRKTAALFLASAKTKEALNILQSRLPNEDSKGIKVEIKKAIAELNKSGIH